MRAIAGCSLGVAVVMGRDFELLKQKIIIMYEPLRSTYASPRFMKSA